MLRRGEIDRPHAQLSSPRPIGRTRRAAVTSSSPPSAAGRGAEIGRPTCASIVAGQPANRAAGPAEDDARDGNGALESAVVVERETQLVDQAGHALFERAPGGGDRLGVPLDLGQRRLQPDVEQPLLGVFGAEPALGREPGDDRLHAGSRDAGEEAGATAGDREVHHVADVAVEDRLLGGRAVAAPPGRAAAASGARARIIPKAERSMPAGSRPARRSGSRKEVTISRRAATTTTSTCGADALLGGHASDHLVLEHGLVERHRDLLLGLEADRRLHLLRVLDQPAAAGCGRSPAGCRCRAGPAWEACAASRGP